MPSGERLQLIGRISVEGSPALRAKLPTGPSDPESGHLHTVKAGTQARQAISRGKQDMNFPLDYLATAFLGLFSVYCRGTRPRMIKSFLILLTPTTHNPKIQPPLTSFSPSQHEPEGEARL